MFQKHRKSFKQLIIIGVTCIGAFSVVFPAIWMFLASVRPIMETLQYPPKLIPQELTAEFYLKLFRKTEYFMYFLNSYIVSVVTTLLCLAAGGIAAYGFSRFKLRWGRFLLVSILALQMIPAVSLLIPYFRIAHSLRIYDTRLMLVFANTSFVLPICVWFLKAYIDQIPIELEEAALIDGATRLKGLWLIIFPLVVPGLIGVGTLAFLRSWNEFLFAVSFTETPKSQTLTVGISLFFGEYVRDWGGIMALTTVASVPLLIIFFVFQKRVIEGVMQGSLK